MVKISYCSNCQKAYRFHIKRRALCDTCKEAYELIDVPRTKYFLIQFPLLLVGMLIIIYSIYLLSIEQVKFAEPMGYFILGFSALLFALAVQIMDNKAMELHGKELGIDKFGTQTEKDQISELKIKTKKEQPEKTKSDRVITTEIKKVTQKELFTKPNKQKTIIKEPKSKPSGAPVKISTLKNIIKPGSDKKKARKIRRAL